MGEEQSTNTEVDFKSPYYPLSKEESILGAADESFSAWNLYITLQNSIQFADYKINLLFFIAGLICDQRSSSKHSNCSGASS